MRRLKAFTEEWIVAFNEAANAGDPDRISGGAEPWEDCLRVALRIVGPSVDPADCHCVVEVNHLGKFRLRSANDWTLPLVVVPVELLREVAGKEITPEGFARVLREWGGRLKLEGDPAEFWAFGYRNLATLLMVKGTIPDWPTFTEGQ
jgi:hypothetical protein